MSAWAIARRAVALAAVGLVLGAGPAAADAAEPGDYSSVVTRVEPDPGGFSIETAGGDSFLELTVEDGVEVVVLGYEGEPYLRFSIDGTVEQNRNSPATYINDDRYGSGDLAPEELQGADVTALEPEWEEVAADGTFAWHDHRTHEMRPESPVPRGESYDWSAPVVLEVDGQIVEVFGEITFEEDVSPLPWAVLAVAAAVALGLLAGRLPAPVPGALVAGVGLAAAVVSLVGWSSQPSGTGASVVPVVIALVSTVVGVAAATLARTRTVLLLVSGVFLASWGVFRLAVLTNPVLPTEVPFGVERLVTALAIGLGLGAVAAALRSGALTTALLPTPD